MLHPTTKVPFTVRYRAHLQLTYQHLDLLSRIPIRQLNYHHSSRCHPVPFHLVLRHILKLFHLFLPISLAPVLSCSLPLSRLSISIVFL